MVCGQPRIKDPVGLPLYWCRDGLTHRDIRRGVSPIGRDLIATRLAVAIRSLSRRVSWSPQGLLSRHFARSRQGCRGALPRRDGVVTALGVVTVPVLPRRLSPLLGTPILGSLLRECSELRACSSWQPTGRTLELRGK
ncbi:hypothetical protein Taro_043675 [Colocasia esculenta]|uniref:Uncharacterized protein n=1 Tax=Colocasia esculenta TaxID=4460 RepID=A0A843WS07_COLES|nr:hypothetical protein [Colocasia esculenta]